MPKKEQYGYIHRCLFIPHRKQRLVLPITMYFPVPMIQLWHRDVFRITGPFGGESSDHRWIPLIKRVIRGCSVFYVISLSKLLNNQVKGDLRCKNSSYDSIVFALYRGSISNIAFAIRHVLKCPDTRWFTVGPTHHLYRRRFMSVIWNQECLLNNTRSAKVYVPSVICCPYICAPSPLLALTETS